MSMSLCVSFQATGKTSIYDFDEWTRSHYTETFNKKTVKDEKLKQRKRNDEVVLNINKIERSLYLLVGVVILMAGFTWLDAKKMDEPANFRKMR
jgi:DnaJ family protein C protein 30